MAPHPLCSSAGGPGGGGGLVPVEGSARVRGREREGGCFNLHGLFAKLADSALFFFLSSLHIRFFFPSVFSLLACGPTQRNILRRLDCVLTISTHFGVPPGKVSEIGESGYPRVGLFIKAETVRKEDEGWAGRRRVCVRWKGGRDDDV